MTTPDAEIAWILSTFQAPVVKLNVPELVPPTRGLPLGELSDGDIRRIAEAVVDEQERRAAHPLRVTPADVRRWIR